MTTILTLRFVITRIHIAILSEELQNIVPLVEAYGLCSVIRETKRMFLLPVSHVRVGWGQTNKDQ